MTLIENDVGDIWEQDTSWIVKDGYNSSVKIDFKTRSIIIDKLIVLLTIQSSLYKIDNSLFGNLLL